VGPGSAARGPQSGAVVAADWPADPGELRRHAATWPGHQLTPRELLTLELMLGGALAPQTGFTADDPLVVTHAAEHGTTIALRDDEGATVAGLVVESVRPTGDRYAITGEVAAVEGIVVSDFRDYRHSATELARTVADRGWTRAVVYQPRHIVTQEETAAVAAAVREIGGGLLLQPFHGAHAVGDLEWYAMARCAVLAAEILAEDLGPDRCILALTPDPGAADNALRVAANSGGTHLLIDAADDAPAEPGLEIVRLPLTSTATLPAAAAAELARLRPPPSRVGFTVFFTGFSGSGKSTIAKALAGRLLEVGPRRVTLLDGDVVRRHLSSELTFSREHRDLNIRRIGFVASEATRHGGVAICAPIAPYDATRKWVRELVEHVGAFVLVYVATPLEVCETRDRKGLYARARSGDLSEFTGISDPYEVPGDAEITIDTVTTSVDDAVDVVLAYLSSRGFLDT
jgi:sulfate adenylyltransferase